MIHSAFVKNIIPKQTIKTLFHQNIAYSGYIRRFSNEIRFIKSTKELSSDIIGETVKIQGWLHFMRKMGKIVFFVVNDGYDDIQVKMTKDIGI